MLDRTVRQLMALVPPDRRPATPLAHARTVALVALRTTLQLGGQGAPPAGWRNMAEQATSVSRYVDIFHTCRDMLGDDTCLPHIEKLLDRTIGPPM
jgi:hypothetical protein